MKMTCNWLSRSVCCSDSANTRQTRRDPFTLSSSHAVLNFPFAFCVHCNVPKDITYTASVPNPAVTVEDAENWTRERESII